MDGTNPRRPLAASPLPVAALVRALAVVALLTLAPPLAAKPALAQADASVALTELIEIERRLATDPAGALDAIDAALAREGDSRVRLDLLRARAEAALALDRPDEAAAALAAAARLAGEERGRLALDPVPLWREAAALFERASRLDAAEAAMLAVLREREDGGAPAAERAGILDDLAALRERAEDAEGAARYRLAARETVEGRDKAGPTRSVETGYRAVRVHYATDRARTGDATPAAFYGGARADGLDYGVSVVTIPATHRAGALEAPSIWRLEFAERPTRHVMLRSVTPMDGAAFHASLAAEIGDTLSREAFVYVHGYNQSFEQSVKRAAQIAHDMGFDGVPIAYSWPSRGTLAGYAADTASVRLSGRRLAGFLDEVVARSGATRLHVVAHSMGNRAVTDALELMAARAGPAPAPLFDQLVFAAPDVDAGLFAAMIETIRPIARRLTLYVSGEDWALRASRALHGDAPRAGQADAGVPVPEGVDRVDMSALGEDMLAHGYFAEDASALVDLATLFWRNAAPDRRCGIRDGGLPWRYDPETCDDAAMLRVLAELRRGTSDAGAEALARAVLGEDRAESVSADLARLLAAPGQ